MRSVTPALFVLSCVAYTTGAAGTASGTASAATLKHDFNRCHAYGDIDACYDAIRWNPNDPALLVALGDALERAQRPADALRNYQRAAGLAPGMRGLAAKISVAEAKLRPKRVQKTTRAVETTEPAGKYSNAAPEAQSH